LLKEIIMAKNKTLIITLSEDQSLEDVQEKIKEKGFTVDQVLDQIGCITGSASDEVAAQVRKLPGVEDVSPDFPIDIGPPDAPVTW
jgi:uncharacterized protein YaaQ